MMHTVCKYRDNTELVVSDIIKDKNGNEKIKVVFERPMEYGFDTIIFELPSYKITRQDGHFTEKEIEMFKSAVRRGAPAFYRWAQEGGFENA